MIIESWIIAHSYMLGVLTLGHETAGMSITETIYDDSNVEQMASISPEASHRHVDLAIVQADKEGKPYTPAYVLTFG